MGFSFESSSDFFHWIVCKIAGTSTPLPINRKFQLSDFEVLRVDCTNLRLPDVTTWNFFFRCGCWGSQSCQVKLRCRTWSLAKGHPVIALVASQRPRLYVCPRARWFAVTISMHVKQGCLGCLLHLIRTYFTHVWACLCFKRSCEIADILS